MYENEEFFTFCSYACYKAPHRLLDPHLAPLTLHPHLCSGPGMFGKYAGHSVLIHVQVFKTQVTSHSHTLFLY